MSGLQHVSLFSEFNISCYGDPFRARCPSIDHVLIGHIALKYKADNSNYDTDCELDVNDCECDYTSNTDGKRWVT